MADEETPDTAADSANKNETEPKAAVEKTPAEETRAAEETPAPEAEAPEAAPKETPAEQTAADSAPEPDAAPQEAVAADVEDEADRPAGDVNPPAPALTRAQKRTATRHAEASKRKPRTPEE